MLTKEECEKALSEIEYSLCELEETKTGVDVYCLFDENLEIVKQLIKEYFDPQPYKFEEYYDCMWVWDDKWKQLRELMDAQDFEEGRFFPITKAYQERK